MHVKNNIVLGILSHNNMTLKGNPLWWKIVHSIEGKIHVGDLLAWVSELAISIPL